jgi:hypothetical protein
MDSSHAPCISPWGNSPVKPDFLGRRAPRITAAQALLEGAVKPSLPMKTRSGSLLHRLQVRFAQARFFTFSALLHLIILVMAGSVVLIKNTPEPPDFDAGTESGLFSNDPPSSQPPPAPPSATTPVFTPATPQSAAPSIPTLTSSAPPSPFAQAASAGVAIGNKIPDAQVMGDKVTAALNGMARAGGKGGFFGTLQKAPSALVGTFYDLKQTRSRKPTGISPDEYHKVFRRFVRENWRDSILNDYFKAPKPLYASQIMIPNMPADEGPKAFGMEKEVQPSRWLVHYKARVAPPEDGTYRFVGAGDDVMVVRFNGKVVLDRCWYQNDQEWQPEKNYDYGWTNIPNGFARGDAIRVRAGQSYDLEVLIGEQPGGLVFACLLMEKEGEQYERDARGNPILPPFRVADVGMPEREKGQTLPPYAESGPVWTAASTRAGSGSMLDQFFAPK